VQRGALLVLRAALHGAGGAVCWQLGRVLEALNGLVEGAGPAFAAQPGMLVAVVQVYAEAEAQLAAALKLQAAADPRGVAAGALPAPQRPPPPPAICGALQRAAQLPSLLPPGRPAADWLLANAAAVPGAAERLLCVWLQPCATACSGADGEAWDDTGALQRVQAVAAAVAAAPGALPLLCRALPTSSGAPDGGGAESAAALLAAIAWALRFRPEAAVAALLGEAQLAAALRRLLLEHGGRPGAASCVVAAGCTSVLATAAEACGHGDDTAAVAEAAVPLVSRSRM
jgi:hypothetical protein